MRHFLDISSVSRDELVSLLFEAQKLKAAHLRGEANSLLSRKLVGLIFEKPSLRTRVSFEAAVIHLGGRSLFLPAQEVGLGWRESVPDFARTMNHYVDALVLRVFKHSTLIAMTDCSEVPIINGLSDIAHPCQTTADLLTMQELFGDLKGRTVVFVGDGNNVARSLALGCGTLGIRFRLAAPKGYGFDDAFRTAFRKHSPKGSLESVIDPIKAVRDADIIYGDVWTSMGQEDEREKRLRDFAHYQINAKLLAAAPKHARVMHCLPAHRGEEITDEVVDGDRSVVFQQAGNRLHAQKAILAWLLTK
ncbi:MAG TPA: ornithine carbamoyltransferase [Gemmataceae bacterium]|nr:ornithine carbamoyltransferase [Gemmataceae bacterium]